MHAQGGREVLIEQSHVLLGRMWLSGLPCSTVLMLWSEQGFMYLAVVCPKTESVM